MNEKIKKEITSEDLAKVVNEVLKTADNLTISRICGYAEGLLAQNKKGA